MTPEQFAEVAQLFEKAITLPPEHRGAFLDQCCGPDPAIRRRVEGMLARHDETPDYLESPALGRGFHVADVDELEQRVRDEFAAAGRYRIVAPIGEEASGTVYHAEQLEPVRRSVALKIIKAGMDTRRVIARFEVERQTLAVMNHPAIARVFDAGATPSGRPYFAMELVDGRPLTTHCDAETLDIRARLAIFLRVCEAVQHAHQRGIIHRDLKPANILVAADGPPCPERSPGAAKGQSPSGVAATPGPGQPKIIDFGIARAMYDTHARATLLTERGQLIGTPQYMSPEQATGGEFDVDTRTDVYSLGVILYELLTGVTPFESKSLRTSDLRALQQLFADSIRPDHPRASGPSRRPKRPGNTQSTATNLCARRGVEPAALARLLRGDLDCIVMKALEKDRARRYPTVASLADDIRRYLAEDLVEARPPTATYRLQKFLRRHRWPLAAGAAMVALLIGGIIGTGAGLLRSMKAERRAADEAERARAEADVAAAVIEFLNTDLLSAVSPDALGHDVRMREVLEVASRRLEGQLTDKPEVKAAIHLTLGRTFLELADLDHAEQHLCAARELRLAHLGPASPSTLEATHLVGTLYTRQDRNPEAEALFREVLAGRRRVLGPEHRDTIAALYDLAVALAEQGRLDESDTRMTEALHLGRRVLGERDQLTLSMIRGMAILRSSMGQPDQALPLLEEAERRSREVLGAEHPDTLLAMRNLATLYNQLERFSEAEKLYDQILEVSRRLRGVEHPATQMIVVGLAATRAALGRDEEADALFKSAYEVTTRTLAPGHSVTTSVQLEWGSFLLRRGRSAEAAPLLLQAVEGLDRAFGPDYPGSARAIAELVQCYEATGEENSANRWRQRIQHAEARPNP